MLELTQKGDLDVTRWQTWFLSCLNRAIDGANETLSTVLAKARFWERFAAVALNERQITVLNRLLDGFEGNCSYCGQIGFFKRPDGRAVPACGYRVKDMIDDNVGEFSEQVNNPPAGGLLNGAKRFISEPPPPVYWH